MGQEKNTQPVQEVAAVDEVLVPGKMFVFGLQHVLVMYAGAIAVPILIGTAAKLPAHQIAFLISADLFICGVASFIQSAGIWKFGIRLPLMMGVTFAAVPPMLVMVNNPNIGLQGMFGSIIVAGLVAMLVAPVVGKLVRLFPPVVTGTVITVTGLNLIPVGVNWISGRGENAGSLSNLAISALVLAVIIVITKYGRGFLRNVAVLVGIAVGFLVATSLGMVDFSRLNDAAWIALVTPFHFGLPTFDLGSILALSIIMVVVMIETTGMMLAVAEMVGKKISTEDVTRGLRVDGLGTFIGGIFNTFPYVTFSQNVGMVVATGINVLANVDYKQGSGRNNLFIVAVSVVIGMMPMVNNKVFSQLPEWLSPFTHSGIVLSAITALVLNLYLNGVPKAEPSCSESGAVVS